MSNTGNRNIGDRNIGNRNIGDRNAGDWNTGDWNTGNSNTGDWNTGNSNTGDWNAGYRNTGDRNTGNRNTGDWNIGNRNTGDWNNVDKETGFFNTVDAETVRVFNNDCNKSLWENSEKPSFLYFDLTQWIRSDDMTNEEKSENPEHETIMGYLKKYDYKEQFKKSYNEASQEDKELLLKLPNFDADVFLEISGIDVRKNNNTDKIDAINMKIKELQEEVDKLKV